MSSGVLPLRIFIGLYLKVGVVQHSYQHVKDNNRYYD